jgi:hypothetical protein
VERVAPKLPNTTSRLIAMAVSLTGSADEVRAQMRSSPADFEDYCAGRKEPVWPELDKLITLIVREQGSIIAKNRELIARNRERLKGSDQPK